MYKKDFLKLAQGRKAKVTYKRLTKEEINAKIDEYVEKQAAQGVKLEVEYTDECANIIDPRRPGTCQFVSYPQGPDSLTGVVSVHSKYIVVSSIYYEIRDIKNFGPDGFEGVHSKVEFI